MSIGKSLFFLGCSVILAACGWIRPYQPTIQQGNFLTEKMIQRVHPGMTRAQVVDALGYPVLENPFSSQHWAYVYTLQKNGGPIERKHVDVCFRGDLVTNVQAGV